MSEQGSRKIIVHRQRTIPTGSYASEKILVGYEQDLAPLNDLPTELRKGLALLDVILAAEMTRIMKERGHGPIKEEGPPPIKEPEKPTETPELYASLLESLEWTPGARAGREWILIPRNEEKLRAVLNLMRQIDPNGYHTVGKWKYRIEGDFLAKYGPPKGITKT